LKKGHSGFSLVEVLIAVALLSIIGISLLSSLGTSSKALMTIDERETAKNIAEAAMEHIKSVEPSTGTVYPYYCYPIDDGTAANIQDILDEYPGYSIANTGGSIYVTVIDGRSPSEIHEINIIVLHSDRQVYTLTGLKTN